MQVVWIATAHSYRLTWPIPSVVYLRDIRRAPPRPVLAQSVSRDKDRSAQLKQRLANNYFIRHVHQVAGYLKSPSSILIFEGDEMYFLSPEWKQNTCNFFTFTCSFLQPWIRCLEMLSRSPACPWVMLVPAPARPSFQRLTIFCHFKATGVSYYCKRFQLASQWHPRNACRMKFCLKKRRSLKSRGPN